ncbi:MAG: adenylate kinase family protein [Methanomicrobiales archaeon]
MAKIIFITGTPGVGKSTISSMLAKRLNGHLISINQIVNEKTIYTSYDSDKEYKIVDLDSLCNEMNYIINQSKEDIVIVDGHLSHYMSNPDIVIVLRTNPEILSQRLEQRGYSEKKIRENIESEAIDLITYEAVEIHGDKVNEIDNTKISPETVVKMILDVIEGNKKFIPGKIDFSEFFINEINIKRSI